MTLAEVFAALGQFDIGDTIYARKSWSATSGAVVAEEPEAGVLPAQATIAGMAYFLEIAIAREIIEDVAVLRQGAQTQSAICQRLIDYAINDA